MPKLKLEPLLVVTTLAAALVTQSWPAVVAFIASAALYYLTDKRDDQLAAIQTQAVSLKAEADTSAQKLAEHQQSIHALESRLVTLENVIAMAQARTTF